MSPMFPITDVKLSKVRYFLWSCIQVAACFYT